MAFIPFTDVAEVVVGQSMSGQVVDTVLNFEFPSALTISILDDLCQAVINTWISDMAAQLTSNLDLNFVKATDLTTASSPSVTVAAPAGTDGNVAPPTVPLNGALVISQATDNRGRSFRGRTYQAGMPAGALINEGTFSETYADSLLAGYVEWIHDIEDSMGCIHGVASRRSGGAPRLVGVFTPITEYFCEANLDSQRRRLVGRGV